MPAVPAIIAGAVAVGSAIYGGIQSYKTGRENERLLNAQAERVEAIGREEEADFRREGEQLKGNQRAMLGASGVDIVGTPLLVLADTANQIEKDALKIRQNASDEKSLLQQQAKEARRKGRSDLWSGILLGSAKGASDAVSIYEAQTGGFSKASKERDLIEKRKNKAPYVEYMP